MTRISQSFTTIIGGEYLLSFDLSAFGGSSGIRISPIDVTVGPAFATYTGTGDSYIQHTLPFFADSTLTTVAVENASLLAIGEYPHLDNVSVNAVPIPAAFWLFGTGLIGLVGVARRKVTSLGG